MTNSDRADRAQQALLEHNALIEDPGADLETMMKDFLTDLRHLAKREDIHYEQVDNFAFQQFEEERDNG